MKGQNKDIADSKGFGLWLLQVIMKTLITVPGFILSAYQAVKGKYFGGYMYTLAYGGDIWGNKLIGPHANAYWITSNGYKFGQDEPISLPLAINVARNTYTEKMKKYVIGIEKVDPGHMKMTLLSHGFLLDLETIDLNLKILLDNGK